MKQLELIPPLKDQELIDNYRLTLDVLKSYKKIKFKLYRQLHQCEKNKRDLIKARDDNAILDFTYRRLLKQTEKNINEIKENKWFMDADPDISLLYKEKKIIEREICDAARF